VKWKTPLPISSGVFTGIGKKRGRKEDLRIEGSGSRHSAVLHVYILEDNFEWVITEV
jgi:hypothetical protein